MMSYFQRAFTVSRCDMYRISLVAERKTKGTCRMRRGNGWLFSVHALDTLLLTCRYPPSAFLAISCALTNISFALTRPLQHAPLSHGVQRQRVCLPACRRSCRNVPRPRRRARSRRHGGGHTFRPSCPFAMMSSSLLWQRPSGWAQQIGMQPGVQGREDGASQQRAQMLRPDPLWPRGRRWPSRPCWRRTWGVESVRHNTCRRGLHAARSTVLVSTFDYVASHAARRTLQRLRSERGPCLSPVQMRPP
jgi:hypothetical protein